MKYSIWLAFKNCLWSFPHYGLRDLLRSNALLWGRKCFIDILFICIKILLKIYGIIRTLDIKARRFANIVGYVSWIKRGRYLHLEKLALGTGTSWAGLWRCVFKVFWTCFKFGPKDPSEFRCFKLTGILPFNILLVILILFYKRS